MKSFVYLFALFLLVSADSKNQTPFTELDCAIDDGTVLGYVNHDSITEASGLVASKTYPGVLYTHNDSGDKARIFALLTNGTVIAEIYLDGVDAIDFEDITLGKAKDSEDYHIYVADFGNNFKNRTIFNVYRFKEPNLRLTKYIEIRSFVIRKEDYTTISLTTTNAPKEDFETLMFDPLSEDVYLISKNHEDPKANIYRFSPPDITNREVIVMKSQGVLQLQLIVAGDISFDGRKIALRQKDDKVFIWDRNPMGILVESVLLNSVACEIELKTEPQGESMAFSGTATGFFSLSEGRNQPLNYYQLEKYRTSPVKSLAPNLIASFSRILLISFIPITGHLF